jgi:hypothetical protein
MADASNDLGLQPVSGGNDDLGLVPVPSQQQPTDDLGLVPVEPNMNPAKAALMGNYKAAKAEAKSTDGKPQEPDEHPAKNFWDDWVSGWQLSTLALGVTRHKLPDTVLPEDAGRFARILNMAGTAAGDIPAYLIGAGIGGVAGATAGAVAGSPVGGIPGAAVGAGVGAALGSQAGGFALTSSLRQILMDHYKKGDIHSFEDFYDRASGAFLAGLKGGATGLATGAAGMGAGALMPAAASPFIKMGAMTAAEGSVMTTVGKVLDGKFPSLSDFADTALLMGGIHAVGFGATGTAKPAAEITSHITNKLMDVYAKTGFKPSEIHEMAAQDPVLHQQLMSKDPGIPEALNEAADKNAPGPKMVTVQHDMSLTKSVDGIASFKVDGPEQELKVEALADKDNPSLPNETEPKQRSAAVNSVLSRIGEQPDAPKEKMSFDKFYYNILDDKDPLKKYDKGTPRGRGFREQG